ncbi:MAG: sugar phosphate isomerase/epimerase, partial [Gemmatimonadetes bacterium]|nr:sugar phosphate isomerase/epimerase [Gemmatimonadota bacterium]
LAMQEATPRIGLTLDVGHLSFEEGAGYREFGSIGGLIRYVGRRLVHVHAHDYDGVRDHLPVGAGRLDWDDIAEGLRSIGYEGVVCLELDPDRATPEQLLQSRDRLRELLC